MSLEINFILDIIIPLSFPSALRAVHMSQFMISFNIRFCILRLSHLHIHLESILPWYFEWKFRILLRWLNLDLTTWNSLWWRTLRWINRGSWNRMCLIVVVDIFHRLLVVCVLLCLMTLLHVMSSRLIILFWACDIIRERIETQIRNLARLLWFESWTINKQFIRITDIEAKLVRCFFFKFFFFSSFLFLLKQELFKPEGIYRFHMFLKNLCHRIAFTLKKMN